ncbi:hypothetical protein [Calothrix sp. NIES-3974]|nr:hypothetical protein [Calothrix sp. NIES-3974]
MSRITPQPLHCLFPNNLGGKIPLVRTGAIAQGLSLFCFAARW